MSAAKKQYVLYDERAQISAEYASVLSTAPSLREARTDRRDMFPDAVIFEYDVIDGELRNGRVVL